MGFLWSLVPPNVKAAVLAGLGVLLLASWAAAFGWGWKHGADRAEAKAAIAQAARDEAAKAATNEFFRRQAMRAAEQEKEAADLRRKVKEHEDYIAHMADGPCLVGPDADRLRDIWK
jgi:hypothetical protein